MGVEDFLLGRNFLRTYQVLVDLTSMKIVFRAPVQPVWKNAYALAGDSTLEVPIAIDRKAVPQHEDDPKTKPKVDNDHVDFFNKDFENNNLSTDSQLTSSSEFEFLSSTDTTEVGLSDQKNGNAQISSKWLISGPESRLQEVKKLWALKRTPLSRTF